MSLSSMSHSFQTRTRIAPAHTTLRRIALLALAASLSTFAPAQAAPAPAAVPASTPPMNGIAHIAIRVKDIAASVTFYHKLGFDQAFANTGKAGVVTQSFVKLNDRQFIELYPVTDRDTRVEFLHLCFEGADLNAIHDYYVAEGLTPISVRTAAMSCSDASGPATSRAGSPGNRCTNRKTMMLTASRTGMVPASRRIR